MADIRINSLPTTASASSSDDFLALDGATNGTRKLNAYSPTFGGNLTVSGTGGITSSSISPLLKATSSALGSAPKLTLENTNLGAWNVYLSGTDGGDFKIDQDSTNKFRIAYGTGNATLAGNLTVSGGTITGGTSGMSLASGGTNQNITLTPDGTGEIVVAKPTASGTRTFVTIAETGSNADTAQQILFKNTQQSWAQGAFCSVRSGATANFHLDFIPATSGALNASSAAARLASNGNLLLGTTTDSSNGKLQLATHTTSAGGIGFGTDTSLYRDGTGYVSLYGPNADTTFRLWGGATQLFRITNSSTISYVQNLTGSLQLASNGITALTLDSTQNATFAKNLIVSGNQSVFGGGSATNAPLTVTYTSATKEPFAIANSASGGKTWYIGDGTGVGAGNFAIRNATDATNVLAIGGGGNMEILGSIKTSAPSGGTAGAWKLGIRVAATTTLDTTQYLQVDIGGTLYKVALVTS